MRPEQTPTRRLGPADDADPRDGMTAEIIDLSTRHVLPAVTQRKPRSEGVGLAAGVVLVALLGGVTLWSMDGARKATPAATQPARAPGDPMEHLAPEPQVTEPGAVEADPDLPPEPGELAVPPQSALAAEPSGNPFASPTVVFDAGTLSGPAVHAEGAAVPGDAKGDDDFASRIGGVGGSTATATAMVNPRTTVTQGTLIPAVLETAIDTDVPGYTRAIVSADVRSFDGSTVLVPRSSRLIGQYKSGMQAGQKRAYVIWTRLIRPDGVSVNISSPAVTFAGETGLPGNVNSHFFERFGSAMLLSVIGGLSAIGGGTAAVITGGGQSAAATAVGQTGQIAPTIRVRQGQPIRVFTARDLDFSTVTPR